MRWTFGKFILRVWDTWIWLGIVSSLILVLNTLKRIPVIIRPSLCEFSLKLYLLRSTWSLICVGFPRNGHYDTPRLAFWIPYSPVFLGCFFFGSNKTPGIPLWFMLINQPCHQHFEHSRERIPQPLGEDWKNPRIWTLCSAIWRNSVDFQGFHITNSFQWAWD